MTPPGSIPPPPEHGLYHSKRWPDNLRVRPSHDEWNDTHAGKIGLAQLEDEVLAQFGGESAQGDDGLSAYQLAVAAGFEGTTEEWLASLHGDDGRTPVKGVDYFDGAPGYTPVKGVDYFDGTNGTNGKTVLTGSGAPAAGLGTDGDFYYDPGTKTMYGPKAGTWPAGVSLQGSPGGQGSPGNNAPTYQTLANGTTAMALATNAASQVTPNLSATFTTTVPAAGTVCHLVILTSGTTSYTITFGSGFKGAGTLATGTTSGKYFAIEYISTGTYLLEVKRSAAL